MLSSQYCLHTGSKVSLVYLKFSSKHICSKYITPLTVHDDMWQCFWLRTASIRKWWIHHAKVMQIFLCHQMSYSCTCHKCVQSSLYRLRSNHLVSVAFQINSSQYHHSSMNYSLFSVIHSNFNKIIIKINLTHSENLTFFISNIYVISLTQSHSQDLHFGWIVKENLLI